MAQFKRKELGGGADIQPLPSRVYKNVPLVRVAAFRQISKYTNKPKTMFSLYFNSGHPMSDTDGEIITDDNGNQRPHLFNEGYVLLSFHQKSNMYPILRALGFRGEQFMDSEGNYLDELDIDIEFGTNSKGENFAGYDLEELPLYAGGPKKEVEVEVTRFTMNGISVIGRVANLDVEVSDGWNRVAQYMPADDPTPLVKVNGQPQPAAIQAPAAQAAAPAATPAAAAAPAAGGRPLSEKEIDALQKQLVKAGLSAEDLEAVALHTTGMNVAQLTGGRDGSAFTIFTLAKQVEEQGIDPYGALLPELQVEDDGASPFGEPDEAAFA